jgi:eukaryotic-like serine/threonine-protein kinase
MESERWQKIEQLYHSALEVELSQRAAFIDQACAGDQSLIEDVRSLLAQAEGRESFLEAPAMEVAAQALAMSAAAAGASPSQVSSSGTVGTRPIPAAIGRYRVVRLLGEGGMGVVYEAEQEQPRRIVALKVIKPGYATTETLRRFQHESQALGRLQHPGIAQIYEASTADTGLGPQPYFAMELIRGQTLLEYADAHQLNVRQRLELMAKVCDAVEHAHQRGVIHRDLKPGNILVDETGQPKILDFGVARVTESDAQPTRQTDLGQLVGTLAYMSPEQVTGDPLAVDNRSDVYSVGVILYELLAHKLPYNVGRKPLHEAVEVIREEEPTHLSSINRGYRGDIDTIVAKALEKDKARRYASAADLAGDIRRYLADEPITARPPSASYQLQKFARRHRALVIGTAAVFLVLAAGVVASTWGLLRARAEKRRADAETATAQAVNDFLQNDLLAQASANRQAGPSTKPDPDLKVRTALDRAAARIGGKFDRQPEVEAAIRDTIGQTYMDLGLYPEARKQFERALDLDRRMLGAQNPKTLRTMSQLGRTTYLQGKYAEAQALEGQALEIQRRLLGAEHHDTLVSMNVLGNIYFGQGKAAQAEAIFKQILEIRRRVWGPEHPDTLDSMDNLAMAYGSQGKNAQAEALYTQTLDIQRRVLGPDHPGTLLSMGNLANVYYEEGKDVQAAALYSRTLEIESRVLGPEHPKTLSSMGNLANLYMADDKYPEAEALFSRIVEIDRRVLGPEHPNTLKSMSALAVVYRELGKYAQAEALLSPTVELERRVSGAENVDTLFAVEVLAGIYTALGRYARAEALYREDLETERRALGPEHPITLVTLSDVGAMYQQQGKYTLAENFAAKALAGRRRALGSEHPDTMLSAANLALAYQSQGKFAESESLAREAVETDRKMQPDDWQRFRDESLLGASLAGQKKYAEAKPLLLEGYQGMVERKDRIAVPDRHHLDRARQWIVQLYETWGKPEKAAEWKQK